MLQLSGPNNLVFCVRVVSPDRELWGMTAEQIAVYLWPRIADYVADTIAKLMSSGSAVTPPPAPIDVPVVFS